MSDIPSDLEELRRRIDEIDDRLQDLLIERLDIVAGVAATKRSTGGAAAHQPAREAEIIRRLVARNRGAFPPSTLVRMWRELLGATVRLQDNVAVAVFAPPEAQGYWDLARDHYGSHAAMLSYRTTGQVIRAVAEGRNVIGVLPMPEEEAFDPWWRQLLSTQEEAPRVIARLPFAGRGNARPDSADALAIGRFPQQPTGRDRTLIGTENTAAISRGKLLSTLSAQGLDCTFMAQHEQADGVNTLIEIAGFVSLSDPRVEQFRAQLGADLYRLVRFGGYALPLSGAELAKPSLHGFVNTAGLAVAASAKG